MKNYAFCNSGLLKNYKLDLRKMITDNAKLRDDIRINASTLMRSIDKLILKQESITEIQLKTTDKYIPGNERLVISGLNFLITTLRMLRGFLRGSTMRINTIISKQETIYIRNQLLFTTLRERAIRLYLTDNYSHFNQILIYQDIIYSEVD